MSKSFFVLIALLCSVSNFVVNAQSFKKGDKVVDLGVGVGLADVVKVTGSGLSLTTEAGSAMTFTQKLSFEYGAFQFGKSTIGVGVTLSNAYGLGFESVSVGTYDYDYTITHYHKETGGPSFRPHTYWTPYHWTTMHRQGAATVKSKNHIDDISALLKASYHIELSKGLDTYATFGLGISYYKYMITPAEDGDLESGHNDLNNNYNGTIQLVYSYNDADHIKWTDGSSDHVRLAMALCVGARYYINSSFGIYGEFGLTSGSFKKDLNVYNLLSVGASYKF